MKKDRFDLRQPSFWCTEVQRGLVKSWLIQCIDPNEEKTVNTGVRAVTVVHIVSRSKSERCNRDALHRAKEPGKMCFLFTVSVRRRWAILILTRRQTEVRLKKDDVRDDREHQRDRIYDGWWKRATDSRSNKKREGSEKIKKTHGELQKVEAGCVCGRSEADSCNPQRRSTVGFTCPESQGVWQVEKRWLGAGVKLTQWFSSQRLALHSLNLGSRAPAALRRLSIFDETLVTVSAVTWCVNCRSVGHGSWWVVFLLSTF